MTYTAVFLVGHVRQKPDVVVVHAGTNDITRKTNYLKNVKTMVKELRGDSPKTKIVFSSLFQRYDIENGENLVDDINLRLKNYCKQQNIGFIDNSNITKDFLGKKKLHPSIKGSSIFAKNILNFLN